MRAFLLLIFVFLPGFSSKKITPQKIQYLTFEDCDTSFQAAISTAGSSFDKSIKAYKVFPCFPVEALQYILQKHPEKTWVLSEMSKVRILVKLSKESELDVTNKLFPYVKQKSEIEKFLTKKIRLESDLNISSTESRQKLWSMFPSHNPDQLSKPNLRVVKDLKRRGQNTSALKILNLLQLQDKNDLSILKARIGTQKNIARNDLYLKYSEDYIAAVRKRLKRNPKSSYLKKLYREEELKNIRRIWTYRSTLTALKKLNALIAEQCKRARSCAEHFWIKGRIHEEFKDFNQSRIWLKKAVDNTGIGHKEYLNRVWNLVWLESKYLGAEQALKTCKSKIKKIYEKEVFSKIYYWMFRWATNPTEKNKYLSLIKKHHPMSFYLWSNMALGLGLQLETTDLLKFTKNLTSEFQKNLTTLMKLQEPSLAQAYIKFVERKHKNIKDMNWKKLKALNGMYLDLLLDLNAKLISPNENLQFFFSRGFKKDVLESSRRFNIEKELIWSITRQESNFNPYARSWADAFGLMQILPKRAINYENSIKGPKSPTVQSVNPFTLFSPSYNISIGAWLLKENLKKFNGKLPLAIAAYNASSTKVKDWEKRFYNGDWMYFIEEITYRETRKYVKLVLRNREIYKALEASEVRARKQN